MAWKKPVIVARGGKARSRCDVQKKLVSRALPPESLMERLSTVGQLLACHKPMKNISVTYDEAGHK
jgi:hypothetical protein